MIVGSGIAGLCAAESLREHDPKAVISMVSEEPHPFYSRPGLAYFLRNDFPEKQLTIRTADDFVPSTFSEFTARLPNWHVTSMNSCWPT